MKNKIIKTAIIIILIALILIVIGLILQFNTDKGVDRNPVQSIVEMPNDLNFDDSIAKINNMIDDKNYVDAKNLLDNLKTSNSDKEPLYITYSKLYSQQKLYHAAKSILLEGKQKAKNIQNINEQLGIVDEKISNGESID